MNIKKVSSSREFIVKFHDGKTRTFFGRTQKEATRNIQRPIKSVFDATDYLHYATHT
jgi:hypothetical protein